MKSFLLTAATAAEEVTQEAVKQTAEASVDGLDKLQILMQQLIDWGVSAGGGR